MKTYRSIPDDPGRKRLFVGVAEYDVAADEQTLVAYGLGACVAVLLYDPHGIGGLAHAMLPTRAEDTSTSEAKFVDTAVEALVRDVVAAGAAYGRIEGYVVGGARVFDLPELPSEVIDRNLSIASEELDRLGIPVVDTAVGGERGRTAELDVETGEIRIHTAHDPTPTVLRGPEGERS